MLGYPFESRRRRALVVALAPSVAWLGLAVSEPAASESTASAGAEQAVHWGYGPADGPAHWGELSRDWEKCRTGREQSPIDLGSGRTVDQVDPATDYRPTPIQITDNGHTEVVRLKGRVTVRDRAYQLLQMHFHAPSEHTVNGEVFPMEIHLVHSAEDGDLLVIGILVRDGAENKILTDVLKNLPDGPEPSELTLQIDPTTLVAHDGDLWHYRGSLTTPPCSEDVEWLVEREPIEMSADQISAFRSHYAGNARPVQPLDDRELLLDLDLDR